MFQLVVTLAALPTALRTFKTILAGIAFTLFMIVGLLSYLPSGTLHFVGSAVAVWVLIYLLRRPQQPYEQTTAHRLV